MHVLSLVVLLLTRSANWSNQFAAPIRPVCVLFSALFILLRAITCHLHHVPLYDTFTLVCPHNLRNIRGAPWFFLNMCKWHFKAIFNTLVVMHTSRGSSSYISEFKTLLIILYEAFIGLSSITKRGG
jgi:hypothetical protein